MCVDMYASHSYGRQQVLCAMVGTPCVGSKWCADAPGRKIDPVDPEAAAAEAKDFLDDGYLCETTISTGFMYVERDYSFAASQRRIESILRLVEDTL